MRNATLTAKPPGNWTQLTEAKTLLRQMSQTVEDIEDARTIERAKRANSNKPRIPWSQVKKNCSWIKVCPVWANTYNKFDPTSPFGGYKESGFGREGGLQGLSDYVQLT